MFSASRAWSEARGITTLPSWMLHRMRVWAGVLSWAPATVATVGLLSSVPVPNGQYASVTIAYWSCTARRSAWLSRGAVRPG